MKTLGYKILMGMVRAEGVRYDPWGTAMSYLFDVAEILFVEFGVLVKDFRPAPGLSRESISESYPAGSAILPYVETEAVTEADLMEFYTVVDRYRAWCVLAGRDY